MSIIDISNPSSPVTISTPSTGTGPTALYVSGRYAYVVNQTTSTLSVIDVANPASPVTVSTPSAGSTPLGIYVSGRYAYVPYNSGSGIAIMDISNPASVSTIGTASGAAVGPQTVFVSGRYMYTGYVSGTNVSVHDVSSSTAPVLLSSGTSSGNVSSLYVSGRYVYAVSSGGLQIFDVGGLETTSAIVHSLEAGNLQVRNDIIANGFITANSGLTIGSRGFLSQGNGAINGILSIGTSTTSTSLFVQGTSTFNPFTVASSSNASLFTILANGNVGVGTTTPGALFSVAGLAQADYFIAASSTATTTIAGGLNVGNGNFTYDLASGVTSIANAEFGALNFETNAGMVTWTNLPVSAAAATGTVESYTAQIGGTGLMTLYGESAGSGSVRYLRMGIGTSTPTSKLDVYDATSTSNVNLFQLYSDVGGTGNTKFRIDSDGDMFTDGSLTIGNPADVAESYSALEAVDAGTIVAFGTTTTSWSSMYGSATSTASSSDIYEIAGVRKAYNGYEAVGVISTRPGLNLGSDILNGVPVALSGRVPVKVTTENGEVKTGDYLTVSATRPGYAMKLTGEGRSIGRAISSYVTGNDKVMAYIENGYQKLDTAGKYATTTAFLTTGNVDLNANGVAIYNIKSLASASGAWSIDENGRIVAKVLCLEDVCINKDQLTQILNSTGQSSSGNNSNGQVLGTSTDATASSTDTTSTSTPDTIGTSTPSVDAGAEQGTGSDTETPSTPSEPTSTPTDTPAETSSSDTSASTDSSTDAPSTDGSTP